MKKIELLSMSLAGVHKSQRQSFENTVYEAFEEIIAKDVQTQELAADLDTIDPENLRERRRVVDTLAARCDFKLVQLADRDTLSLLAYVRYDSNDLGRHTAYIFEVEEKAFRCIAEFAAGSMPVINRRKLTNGYYHLDTVRRVGTTLSPAGYVFNGQRYIIDKASLPKTERPRLPSWRKERIPLHAA